MTAQHDEARALTTALARLNARAWGIGIGLLFGGGLFVATILLVAKGGPRVGEHLGHLRVYFKGYAVTPVGSLIEFVY